MEENSNIYKKLLKARMDFAKKNIQPSGYNGHADFDYLELQDIVPVANKVFADNGLCLTVTFRNGSCQGILCETDTEGGAESFSCISFEIPHVHIADPAKFRMNEVQALGAEITYIRRYMYMIVLDIVVSDEIDASTKDDAPVVKPALKATPKTAAKPKEPVKETVKEAPKAKAKPEVKAAVKIPTTPAERSEIKKDLTNSEGKADDLQIERLKTLVSEWVHLDPEAKQKATDIMIKTNAFKSCTRKQADKFIDKISGEIEKLKEKE